MNRSDYRAAFDALPFREDFQHQTIQRLRQSAGQQSEKEFSIMKKKRFALVAAALSAVMVVSAAAVVVMLRPADVARHTGHNALAAAFESDDAILTDQSAQVGGYEVTLMGLVSGEGLSRTEHMPDGAPADKTYAVLSMARSDGEAITEDVPELTVSPLVEGYAPWQVNAWTLGGSVASFAEEGVLYYLFKCDSVEPFADHTVYLAVYPGTHMPPDSGTFSFGEDGAIGVKEGKDAALFVLPLDTARADAQKVETILDGMFWNQPEDEGADADEADEAEEEDFTFTIRSM